MNPMITVPELTTHFLQLRDFLGSTQRQILAGLCRSGEEQNAFRQIIATYAQRVAKMPATYEQHELAEDPLVSLHYFSGSSDWYILEKDAGAPDDEEPGQFQAFGYTILNGDTQNAELGYISIAELIAHDVELDLYFTPQPLRMVKPQPYGVRE